ncbi:MAG TPA: heparinase II/III family protein, partial [Chloroflexota bacterium]|nr:heparinase II/III family protein [Chloroflexota bacterium]
NGQYELIGDTGAAPSEPIPGTLAEFAARAGASGPQPTADFATFHAGYAFGRSGWGAERPFADEVAWTVRYGPGVQIHGHPDGGSLLVYGNGSRLLVGSGTYSYNPGAFRDYFLSRAAQNVVTVGGMPYRSSAVTPLLARIETPQALGVSVRIQGCPGVSDVRTVVFSRRLRYIVVDDRLNATTTHRYAQLWHLAPASHPRIVGQTVSTSQPGGDVIIRQLAGTDAMSVVSGQLSPIQGWLTYAYNTKLAAPVVTATKSGRSARFLTLIAPVPDPAVPVRVTSVALFADGYSAVVSIGGQSERIVVRGATVRIDSVR